MAGHDGVGLTELSEGQHRALVAVLDRLCCEYRACFVLLVDAGGRPVAISPEGDGHDLDGLASLAASAAAAAGGMAGLIGAGNVTVVLQEAERDLLQITPAGDCILAVRFQGDPLQGLERIRARLRQGRALRDIRAVLSSSGGKGPAVLAGLADSEIDALLAPVGPDSG